MTYPIEQNLHFCNTGDFAEQVINLVSGSLFKSNSVKKVQDRYTEMIKNFYTEYNDWIRTQPHCEYDRNNDLKIPKIDLQDISLYDKSSVGIDLPVWFNYLHSNIKVMVIGMEPKRNHNDEQFAVLSTPFALSRYMDARCRRTFHLMFNFVAELVTANYSVYVTDINKSYSTIGTGGQKYTGDPKINEIVFEKELNLVQPDILLTLGNHSKRKVTEILKQLQLLDKYSSKLINRTHPGYYYGRGNKQYFQAISEYVDNNFKS